MSDDSVLKVLVHSRLFREGFKIIRNVFNGYPGSLDPDNYVILDYLMDRLNDNTYASLYFFAYNNVVFDYNQIR
jgi:hypothetical protein